MRMVRAAHPTPEVLEKRKVEICTYPSSIDPDLTLSAEFSVPAEPKPLCLFFHGWHMTAESARQHTAFTPQLDDFFVVNVDMRGRGQSTGQPDACGHELIDALDALDYARRTWPDAIAPGAPAYASGGSGGGGNTMTLLGKAPDLFAAGAAWAGMSDYALWYHDDYRGCYRDEMEGKGWIGGSPESNPEGYRSRGAINVMENVSAGLLVIHGRRDDSVEVHHAEKYEARARELGKDNIRFHYNDRGHDSVEWPLMAEHMQSYQQAPQLPQKGTLLVHSFVATQAFWLVLDDPARMGQVDYELDADGRLASLEFSQAPDATPASSVRLRVFGPVEGVDVRRGAERFAATLVATEQDRSHFTWASGPKWSARVRRPE